MWMEDVLAQLKSDIDDENDLNTYFSDYQLINFAMRAIQYINSKTWFCQKYSFLCLQPYFDAYDLPTDFVSAIRVVDFHNQKKMPYAKYNLERVKSQQTVEDTVFSLSPNIYQIDETRRKLYLDFVPDTTNNTDYTVHVDAYGYSSRPFVSIYDEDDSGYYYEPVIIKLVNDSSQISYSRVSATGSTYKGVGTITWSGTTVTLSSADSSMSEGDVLEVAYDYGSTRYTQEFTVDTVAVDYLSFTAEETPTHNISTACNYHWTTRGSTSGMTALKKLYLSEENITNEYPGFSDPTSCYLVDMGLFYNYQPFVPIVGNGTITFSGTTGTLQNNYRNYQLAVGDYLLINKEIRKITSLADGGNYNTITIEEAFTDSVSNLAWRFYRISEDVPIPVEYQKLVMMTGMYYMFLRQGENDRAEQMLAIVDGRIADAHMGQVAENLNNMNRRKSGYDANADINIPYGTR